MRIPVRHSHSGDLLKMLPPWGSSVAFSKASYFGQNVLSIHYPIKPPQPLSFTLRAELAASARKIDGFSSIVKSAVFSGSPEFTDMDFDPIWQKAIKRISEPIIRDGEQDS